MSNIRTHDVQHVHSIKHQVLRVENIPRPTDTILRSFELKNGYFTFHFTLIKSRNPYLEVF